MGRPLALARQHQALADAEAVLFVDHDHRQIAIGDRILKDRVRPDHDIDRPIEQPHQDTLARPPLVAPGEQDDLSPGRRGHAPQRLVMLAGEQFGGGEQRGLRPGLDSDQHGFERHNRLARADIALKQAQHRSLLGEIPFDLRDGPFLRAGQRKRQRELAAIAPVADQRLALAAAIVGAHQHQREAVGEQFVIGEPVAHLAVLATMGRLQRLAPCGPALPLDLTGVTPFGQIGRQGERLFDQPGDFGLGQPFRQRIDRLA